MSFIEERLLDNLSYGFSGGPTWSTSKVILRNGITRRAIKRTRPLHRFSGAFDHRDDGVVSTLLNVFNATMGAAYSFRFKNWMDYELIDEPFGVGDGTLQSYQLIKTYIFGGNSTPVPIKKPTNCMVIQSGGVTVPATIDITTGIVSVVGGIGDQLTATGTFDLPVMFENDEFAAVMEATNFSSIDIQLMEDLSA